MAADALGLDIPEGCHWHNSTIRAALCKLVDDHYALALGTEDANSVYNVYALRPFWFQVDARGKQIGLWRDIPDLANQFVYRSHEDCLHLPFTATFTAPPKPSKSDNSQTLAIEYPASSATSTLPSDLLEHITNLLAAVENFAQKTQVSGELRKKLDLLSQRLANNPDKVD